MIYSEPNLYNDILLIEMFSSVIVFLSVPRMLYPGQETFFEEAAILKRRKTKTGCAASIAIKCVQVESIRCLKKHV